MYQVTYGEYIIYDPRDEDLVVIEPTVDLSVNKSGSFNFTLPSSHPYLDKLQKMQGVVEITDDGVPIYRGRITRSESDFYKNQKFYTEGVMAYLNDSLIPPFSFPEDFLSDPDYQSASKSGNVVEYFFNWVLNQHNLSVSDHQKLYPGVCTVHDNNNYITRSSSNYSTTMETVLDKLFESSLGGYLLVRYESSATYLDYYEELPLTNTQRIQYGENLIDVVGEIDGTNIYTVIMPIGKDGITLGELPDGEVTEDVVKSGNTLYSISGIEKYGKISKYQEFEDVTIPTNLQTKAVEMLSSHGLSMPETITVKAVDLGWTEDVQHFRIGRMTVVVSSPHGYNISYPLVELSPDILDPGNTEITIGISRSTFTQSQIDTDRKMHYEIESSREETEEFINQKTDVIQTELTNTTTLAQDTRALMLSAFEKYVETSDFEAFQQTIESELNVFADRVEISLSTITESIENVNGDLQSKFSDYNKWFRFTSEGLLIGESENGDSELTLRVDNDRIVFLQSGAEVAYFSNRKLYVTDAQFLSSLQIGNFAFVPRANGNLSFKKVVG